MQQTGTLSRRKSKLDNGPFIQTELSIKHERLHLDTTNGCVSLRSRARFNLQVDFDSGL
jgi:hypothetical protein